MSIIKASSNQFSYVFSYTLSILIIMAICLASSPLYLQQPTKIDVNISASNKTVIKYQHYAFVKFDLKANFSAAFNWNIKEIFVHLNAEYTASQPIKTVIWDGIILRGHENYLNLQNQYAEYYLDDVENVCGQILKLQLYWFTIPNIGLFHAYTTGESQALTIPFSIKHCKP